MLLTFVKRNPWMLFGVAGILLAITAVVRAIKGIPAPEPSAGQVDETHHTNADSIPPDKASS